MDIAVVHPAPAAAVPVEVHLRDDEPATAQQLHELGYDLDPDQLRRAFTLVKNMLGKKKTLEEMDLRRCAETAINPTAAAEAYTSEAASTAE